MRLFTCTQWQNRHRTRTEVQYSDQAVTFTRNAVSPCILPRQHGINTPPLTGRAESAHATLTQHAHALCTLLLAATTSPWPSVNAEPRQVILIIGDGMDEQQITIARNYLKGANGELLLDQMPLRGAAQILTIQDQVNGRPVYVADSANTATSMATG